MIQFTEFECVDLFFYDVPSMMGYGSEPAYMIKKINYMTNTIENISVDELKAIYKTLDSKHDRITVWRWLKDIAEMEAFGVDADA